MIYTITLNPSIDYYLYPEHLELGVINRASKVDYIAAGKGINVSRMLCELGMTSTCIFPAGGFTGRYLIDELDPIELIRVEPIMIEGISRINVKIRHEQETDLNAEGPELSDEAQKQLLKLMSGISADDYVIISGSIQRGLNGLIVRLCEEINANKGRVVLDIPNLPLHDLVACKPYLIKPNLEELQKFLSSEEPLERLLPLAREQLIANGIRSILISLGSEGAYYLSADHQYRITGPHRDPLNTVAAGDSMLSATVGYLARGSELETALKYGVSCGTAAVMAAYLPTREQVEEIYPQVVIEERN
ncbi:MAG: 1-phosphofructokinase family hexose kinase [Erysipelotrichaceae bacterium]|nr:1-phosphofructokinase family hexose kinase [Erysipelotrichaceae bacterium]